MKKIISVGECALDIVFGADGQPLGSMAGGRVINAAAILAGAGCDVTVVGEAAAGAVGDLVVGWLEARGCDVKCIDRFTDGLTPVLVYMPDGTGRMTATRYEGYPEECFDVMWPTIGEGDVVIFGGYYAIDPRMRRRMSQLLQHAAERRAVLVYLPGFLPSQAPRITRVMPAIYENMEMADVVITRTSDLETIYGTDDAERCYADQIDFYTHSLINVDGGSGTVTYYSNHGTTAEKSGSPHAESMMWNAGIVAGVAKAIAGLEDIYAGEEERRRQQKVFADPSESLRAKVLAEATATAGAASESLTLEWQKRH